MDDFLVGFLAGIYRTVAKTYGLLLDMGSFGGNGSLQTYIENITGKMYTIIAVFMIFRLAISLLSYLVDPDKISDKQTGGGKLIGRIIVSIVLLLSLNSVIFKTLTKIEQALFEEDSIINNFFEENYSINETSILNDKKSIFESSLIETANAATGESCSSVNVTNGKFDFNDEIYKYNTNAFYGCKGKNEDIVTVVKNSLQTYFYNHSEYNYPFSTNAHLFKQCTTGQSTHCYMIKEREVRVSDTSVATGDVLAVDVVMEDMGINYKAILASRRGVDENHLDGSGGAALSIYDIDNSGRGPYLRKVLDYNMGDSVGLIDFINPPFVSYSTYYGYEHLGGTIQMEAVNQDGTIGVRFVIYITRQSDKEVNELTCYYNYEGETSRSTIDSNGMSLTKTVNTIWPDMIVKVHFKIGGNGETGWTKISDTSLFSDGTPWYYKVGDSEDGKLYTIDINQNSNIRFNNMVYAGRLRNWFLQTRYVCPKIIEYISCEYKGGNKAGTCEISEKSANIRDGTVSYSTPALVGGVTSYDESLQNGIEEFINDGSGGTLNSSSDAAGIITNLGLNVKEPALKFAINILNGFIDDTENIENTNIISVDFLTNANIQSNVAAMAKRNQIAIDYFMAIIAGFGAIIFILILCIEVVVRNLKLILLQIISPIAVICYMNPNDKVFENWVKQYIGTFLDLFLKLLALNAVLKLVPQLLASINVGGLGTIIFYAGGFLFVKVVPNFISNIFGIKDMGGTFKDAAGLVTKGLGVATGGALGTFAAASVLSRGGSLADMAKTFGSGISGGSKWNFSDMRKNKAEGIKAGQARKNSGVSWWEKERDNIASHIPFARTKAETAEAAGAAGNNYKSLDAALTGALYAQDKSYEEMDKLLNGSDNAAKIANASNFGVNLGRKDFVNSNGKKVTWSGLSDTEKLSEIRKSWGDKVDAAKGKILFDAQSKVKKGKGNVFDQNIAKLADKLDRSESGTDAGSSGVSKTSSIGDAIIKLSNAKTNNKSNYSG